MHQNSQLGIALIYDYKTGEYGVKQLTFTRFYCYIQSNKAKVFGSLQSLFYRNRFINNNKCLYLALPYEHKG